MKTGFRAMPVPGDAPAALPCDFKLEDFLPYQLSVAANRVSRLLARRYSSAFGLTIPEWRVLATIARFSTVSPTAVGEWTAMDKVKVSRAAAGLAARGLVRQSPDPKDGRGRLLRMTRKGETVHQGVMPLAPRWRPRWPKVWDVPSGSRLARRWFASTHMCRASRDRITVKQWTDGVRVPRHGGRHGDSLVTKTSLGSPHGDVRALVWQDHNAAGVP